MPSEYNPNETRRDWETLQKDPDSITQRLRIQGGWLYRTVMSTGSSSLVFVPIPSENTE
jgi:hypothetical protein